MKRYNHLTVSEKKYTDIHSRPVSLSKFNTVLELPPNEAILKDNRVGGRCANTEAGVWFLCDVAIMRANKPLWNNDELHHHQETVASSSLAKSQGHSGFSRRSMMCDG